MSKWEKKGWGIGKGQRPRQDCVKNFEFFFISIIGGLRRFKE